MTYTIVNKQHWDLLLTGETVSVGTRYPEYAELAYEYVYNQLKHLFFGPDPVLGRTSERLKRFW